MCERDTEREGEREEGREGGREEREIYMYALACHAKLYFAKLTSDLLNALPSTNCSEARC